MTRGALGLVLILAACQPPDEERAPVAPGGGGGTGRPGALPDAALDGAFGGDIIGRVCVVTDLRSPASGCAATGADGITVTLDTQTAVTTSDGSFVIGRPLGTNLTWRASGPNHVSSVMHFAATPQIPMISRNRFADLLGDNGVLLAVGQGSVVASVVAAAGPAPDVRATADPAATFATFYDSGSATQWELDGTGARGVAWLAGVAAGPVVLRFVTASNAVVLDPVVVEDDAITYTTVAVP